MVKAISLGLADFPEAVENFFGAKQQVIKIQGSGNLQGVLISAICGRGKMFFVGLGKNSSFVWANPRVFPAADEIKHVAWTQQPIGNFYLTQRAAARALLRAAIINGKLGRI